MLVNRDDWELSETFFNSTTRRIFSTVGVNSTIEFVNTDFDIPPGKALYTCFATLRNQPLNADLVKRLIAEYPYLTPFHNLEYDSRQAAEKIKAALEALGATCKIDRIEFVLPQNSQLHRVEIDDKGRSFSRFRKMKKMWSLVLTRRVC